MNEACLQPTDRSIVIVSCIVRIMYDDTYIYTCMFDRTYIHDRGKYLTT